MYFWVATKRKINIIAWLLYIIQIPNVWKLCFISNTEAAFEGLFGAFLSYVVCYILHRLALSGTQSFNGGSNPHMLPARKWYQFRFKYWCKRIFHVVILYNLMEMTMFFSYVAFFMEKEYFNLIEDNSDFTTPNEIQIGLIIVAIVMTQYPLARKYDYAMGVEPYRQLRESKAREKEDRRFLRYSRKLLRKSRVIFNLWIKEGLPPLEKIVYGLNYSQIDKAISQSSGLERDSLIKLKSRIEKREKWLERETSLSPGDLFFKLYSLADRCRDFSSKNRQQSASWEDIEFILRIASLSDESFNLLLSPRILAPKGKMQKAATLLKTIRSEIHQSKEIREINLPEALELYKKWAIKWQSLVSFMFQSLIQDLSVDIIRQEWFSILRMLRLFLDQSLGARFFQSWDLNRMKEFRRKITILYNYLLENQPNSNMLGRIYTAEVHKSDYSLQQASLDYEKETPEVGSNLWGTMEAIRLGIYDAPDVFEFYQKGLQTRFDLEKPWVMAYADSAAARFPYYQANREDFEKICIHPDTLEFVLQEPYCSLFDGYAKGFPFFTDECGDRKNTVEILYQCWGPQGQSRQWWTENINLEKIQGYRKERLMSLSVELPPLQKKIDSLKAQQRFCSVGNIERKQCMICKGKGKISIGQGAVGVLIPSDQTYYTDSPSQMVPRYIHTDNVEVYFCNTCNGTGYYYDDQSHRVDLTPEITKELDPLSNKLFVLEMEQYKLSNGSDYEIAIYRLHQKFHY